MIVGGRPQWLAEAARAQRYSLTLLLADDVPWVNDGTRVLERRRMEHTTRLRTELDSLRREYALLAGSFQARLDAATRLVQQLLERL
jgi:nicotinamide riboside kinase